MRVVQLTLDDELVQKVDALVAKLGTSRSAFARDALNAALARRRELAQERRHREGYRKKPVGKKELGKWDAEQVWPDE